MPVLLKIANKVQNEAKFVFLCSTLFFLWRTVFQRVIKKLDYLFLPIVLVVNRLFEEIIYIYRQDFSRRQILPRVKMMKGSKVKKKYIKNIC